jgi:protein-S-isoprenylcysteine O-methyltransferase Ste14
MNLHEIKPTIVHKKDKPLTPSEKLKMAVVVVLVQWASVPFLLFCPYLRTRPDLPPVWFGFWLFEASLTTSFVILFFMLVLDHPRIVRERSRKKKKTDCPDLHREQRFHKISFCVSVVGLYIITTDALDRRDTFPVLLNWVGSISIIGSLIWMAQAFRVNNSTYASRVIYSKTRHHQIIQTGPYRIVRHPMYMGMIPFFLGISLCLGSYWGLLPMVLLNVLIAHRTYHEEDFLVQTFGDDYKRYQAEVKSRIIPFVF